MVTGEAADVHTSSDIDPDVPKNMKVFSASELTQASPQSFCSNDVA